MWWVRANGQKSVAVANVHAHEIALDTSGSLIGEDSRWLGGERYQHRIWKRSADGRIIDVVPWTNGFYRSFGLVRDGAGAMYRIDCLPGSPARHCTIQKRDRTGRITNVVRSGKLNWMLGTPRGELYFIDGMDLRRVTRAGNVERVARIGEMPFGLAADAAGNIYVAEHKERTVVRVSPDGKRGVVTRSTAPWGPSGVAVTPRGDLWILEWAGTRARVRNAGRIATP